MALQVIFAGPDDSDTCSGCDDAVNGSPYDPDEDYPIPGTLECMANCRHILQVDGEADDSSGDEQPADVAYVDGLGFSVALDAASAIGDEAAKPPSDGSDPDTADNTDQQQQGEEDPDTSWLNILDLSNRELSAIADELDTDSDVELANALLINGLTIDDAEGLKSGGIDADRRQRLETLMSAMDNTVQNSELIPGLLDATDVESLADVLKNDEEAFTLAETLADKGFDDSESDKAFALAEAMSDASGSQYTAQLSTDDNRWYVT